MKQQNNSNNSRSFRLTLCLMLLVIMVIAYLALSYLLEDRADAEQAAQGWLSPLVRVVPETKCLNCVMFPPQMDMREKPQSQDKTLSPYFFVNSDDETDSLPLKSTFADVNISGVIAKVKITQVYKNEGRNTLEAIYIFPASTKAAVHQMRMTIDERVIDAEIKRKSDARKIYQDAIKNGQTASLLEQQRPNVFQMNVGNILPGDEIRVEMTYVELLVPEDGIYEFVFPTVVGPRYSNQPEQNAPASEKWVKNPYLHEGEQSTFSFGLNLNLTSAIPISQSYSTTHHIAMEYLNKNEIYLEIAKSNNAGNKDFIFHYVLAGEQIETGLMLYSSTSKSDDENFFLLMVEPPKRIEPKQIVPREYIFIIDVSGSMRGFPLGITKKLMKDLFSSLGDKDYFNVMLFASANAVLSPVSLPATKGNIKKAIDLVDNSRGGGGTELIPALKRAMNLPHTEGTSRIVVAATDGYVSVEQEAFELIGKNLNKANLFSFGIGSSVNRFLIEGLARAGLGEPFVITNPENAAQIADRFRKYISSPILQGINVEFDGFDAYDVEPLSFPDLFADRPLVIYGKYHGAAEGGILVTAKAADQYFQYEVDASEGILSEKNSPLKYLWARQRILRLSDMNKLSANDKRIEEVTKLGLKYNLMTAYTSFVAVDKEIRSDGQVVQVKQPLPMPDGVSDSAVAMESAGYAGGGSGRSYGRFGKTIGNAPASVSGQDMRIKKRGEHTATLDETEQAVEEKKELARVKIEAATILGSLDKGIIKRVITKRLKALNACYSKELAKNKKLQGKLIVKFTIDKSGKVVAVSIKQSTLNNSKLEKCLLKLIRNLHFPKPKGGGSVIVSYPFVFGR